MNALFNYFSSIRPERFFLFTALIFGFYFITKVPPFQVPDEPNHFYRAWHIADGNFSAEKRDQRIGGILPVTLTEFATEWWTRPVITSATQKKFVDFNNTALYTTWCYAPSALAISVGKLLGLSLAHIFYLARVFGLLFWLVVIYFSIWLAPVFKWTLCALALLPMSIFINGSISADVVTNAVCFLFIALVLKLSYSHSNIDLMKYLLLVLATALVISVKMVYAPLVLLLFFIPSGRFSSPKIYWLGISGLFFVAACMLLYLTNLTSEMYLSYFDYNPDYRDKVALAWNADIAKQTEHIRKAPCELVQVMGRSVLEMFDLTYCGYIGLFGWVDVHLPRWLVHLMYLILIITALTEVAYLSIYRRLQAVLVFTTIFLLVMLSQHLIWNPVGGDRIMNIQGRYFIPAVPALLIGIGAWVRCTPALRVILVITGSLLALSVSAYVLEHKYN